MCPVILPSSLRGAIATNNSLRPAKERLDCFASGYAQKRFAGLLARHSSRRERRRVACNDEDTTAHSRGMICPGLAKLHPRKNRGRRECRALAAPAALCAERKETHTR